MPPLEPRDHRVSLAEAAAYTRRYRASVAGKAGAEVGGAFHADQVRALLAQPGCAGLRIYRGLDEKGGPATVLVGLDADGNDMTSGTLLEIIFTCPPWCSDANALTRD